MQERKTCIGAKEGSWFFSGEGGEGEETGFVDLGPATLLPPGSRVGVDD